MSINQKNYIKYYKKPFINKNKKYLINLRFTKWMLKKN